MNDRMNGVDLGLKAAKDQRDKTDEGNIYFLA